MTATRGTPTGTSALNPLTCTRVAEACTRCARAIVEGLGPPGTDVEGPDVDSDL
jgi:hypothetical protein